MPSLAKFIFFVFFIFAFGLVVLNTVCKIRSLVILLPAAFIFGLSFFVFLTHTIAYLTGPAIASIISFFILAILAFFLFFIKKFKFDSIENELTHNQLALCSSLAFLICILTYLALYRYGTFDLTSHIPIAMTMYHNNLYPPRDPFRPDYILLYHFGGDLLCGAIYKICGFNIDTAFEITSSLLSGLTFLSFFALAWQIVKNFKLALFAGFCTYFGGGLLWLDAILRYLTKNFPEGLTNLSFFETFINFGIHGSITNPPSVLTFTSTSSLGNPLLIFCLILFWFIFNSKDLRNTITNLIFLNLSLLVLYLTTDWLFATFWACALPFGFVLLINKKVKQSLNIVFLLITSFLLVKTIGNLLFLQDATQSIGRTNILDLGIKEKLFWVTAWGRLTSHIVQYNQIFAFSWDFICEFGLSIILIPLVVYYTLKAKNYFVTLLALIPLFTMPIPLIVDFKLNPVELVRLFSFGNNIIILLGTCGIGMLFNQWCKNKLFIISYIICICFSPIMQLIAGAVFTPRVYLSKSIVKALWNDLNRLKSINDFFSYHHIFDEYAKNTKLQAIFGYNNEIKFLKSVSKNGDVAISTNPTLPVYAGVYTYIPPGTYLYWDQLYSRNTNIYQSIFSTLDPFLLKELNIKWILLRKDLLSPEMQDFLNNSGLFELVYKNNTPLNNQIKVNEIYRVKDLSDYLINNTRKTGWALITKDAQFLEIQKLKLNKITLFDSINSALKELYDIYKKIPKLRKELITAQPVYLKDLEKLVSEQNLNILVEKKF